MTTTTKRKRTSKKRPAAGQKAAAEPRADIGHIIENGFAMLMPFIVERIVAAARPEPVPPTPRDVPGYFEGYQHAIDEARYVVRTGCPGCGCALCRKIMSDDEPAKGTRQ